MDIQGERFGKYIRDSAYRNCVDVETETVDKNIMHDTLKFCTINGIYYTFHWWWSFMLHTDSHVRGNPLSTIGFCVNFQTSDFASMGFTLNERFDARKLQMEMQWKYKKKKLFFKQQK